MAGASKAEIRMETLTGDSVRHLIPELSRLRCEIFREWPYLYAGNLEYERDYLAEFAQGEAAVVAAAWDGDRLVGAATAAPLASHTSKFIPLYEKHGFDPETVFYFGESVLLPQYRGRGIGHAFFDRREAAARSAETKKGQSYELTSFCAVIRNPDDPRRPADYRPLEGFWQQRGYRPVRGMVGSYDWQEVGSDKETPHPMQFWVRSLGIREP